jgi:hypothetical protein
MSDTREPTGFEGRLLVALTQVDQRRAPTLRGEPTLRVWRRPVVLAAAVATVVAAGGATAAVAALSGEQTSFQTAAHSVVAGDAMTVKGSGCAAGSDVRFSTDHGQELGRAVADAEGNFVASITVPDNLAPGALTVAATCPDGSPQALVQRLVVVVVDAEKPLAATLAVAGSATPGGEVVVKGAGCQPGADVSFAIAAGAIGSATAGPDGAYVATVPLASTVAVGTHLLTAECTGGDGASLRLTVDLLVE